jgi:uncharacterized membrane protein YhaH (DUF805 family)
MDKLMSLYTTTEGRIGRQQWWIGAIALGIVYIVVGVIAGMVINNMQVLGWVSLILFVIFAYPLYALYLKRRHDRDNNGLDATIFLAVIGVSLLLQALGISYSPQELPNVGTVMMPNQIGMIIGAITLIYAIYMLVVMGFLRGTVGPNQYGPDPLGAVAPAAA